MHVASKYTKIFIKYQIIPKFIVMFIIHCFLNVQIDIIHVHVYIIYVFCNVFVRNDVYRMLIVKPCTRIYVVINAY